MHEWRTGRRRHRGLSGIEGIPAYAPDLSPALINTGRGGTAILFLLPFTSSLFFSLTMSFQVFSSLQFLFCPLLLPYKTSHSDIYYFYRHTCRHLKIL